MYIYISIICIYINKINFFTEITETISPWSTHGVGRLGSTGEGKSLKGNFRQYLTLEECKKSCDDTLNCNAITWHSTDNTCYLKNKQDACVDRSVDWDRDDANLWNYFWKTCGN